MFYTPTVRSFGRVSLRACMKIPKDRIFFVICPAGYDRQARRLGARYSRHQQLDAVGQFIASAVVQGRTIRNTGYTGFGHSQRELFSYEEGVKHPVKL